MSQRAKPIVPILLGVAMLAVVIGAALTPNLGVVAAQTNTQYGQPTSSSTGLSVYEWLGIAVVIIVVGLLVAMLMMRRRRPPTGAGAAPVQTWQGMPPPGAGGTPTPPPPPPSAPPAAAPAYLETPEDIGHAPPVVPAAATGAAAGAGAVAGAGAAAEEEPDIDSLMAELDKISSEILKRAPKKGSEPPTETSTGGGPPP